jgi:hypothetical protein
MWNTPLSPGGNLFDNLGRVGLPIFGQGLELFDGDFEDFQFAPLAATFSLDELGYQAAVWE